VQTESSQLDNGNSSPYAGVAAKLLFHRHGRYPSVQPQAGDSSQGSSTSTSPVVQHAHRHIERDGLAYDSTETELRVSRRRSKTLLQFGAEDDSADSAARPICRPGERPLSGVICAENVPKHAATRQRRRALLKGRSCRAVRAELHEDEAQNALESETESDASPSLCRGSAVPAASSSAQHEQVVAPASFFSDNESVLELDVIEGKTFDVRDAFQAEVLSHLTSERPRAPVTGEWISRHWGNELEKASLRGYAATCACERTCSAVYQLSEGEK
jgi:hypothetical protein